MEPLTPEETQPALASAAHTGKQPVVANQSLLQVVYPEEGHHTAEPSTFIMGNVLPGGRLRINDTPVATTAEGFFAYRLPLVAGLNTVTLLAETTLPQGRDTLSAQTRQTHVLHLYRDTWRLPEGQHWDATRSLPNQDLSLLLGSSFYVQVVAQPGLSLEVLIPGLLDEAIPLTPLQEKPEHATNPSNTAPASTFWDERLGVFAALHHTRPPIPAAYVYQARIQLPATLPQTPMHTSRYTDIALADLPLIVQQRSQNASEPATRLGALLGRLSVWKGPRGATVAGAPETAAIVRADMGPAGDLSGARLTPLFAGTPLTVLGAQNGWVQIQYPRSGLAWINRQDVALHSQPPAAIPLRLVHVQEAQSTPTDVLPPNATALHLPLVSPRPVHVVAEPNQVQLWLSGCSHHCDFIHYHPHASGIRWVEVAAVGPDSVQLTIPLLRPLAGWQWHYQPTPAEATGTTGTTGVLTLRTWPLNWQDCRVLIDPGHGGEERGGVGLNGIPEKTLNLNVAKQLAEALQRQGLRQVRLTRTTDTTLSLLARTQQAERWPADVVLSLHHNALPDGRDPWEARGFSTYYYHLFSQPLAQALQQGVAAQFPQWPHYGMLFDSLHLTRLSSSASVLLELGFMTHPEEYAQLIQPATQQALVNGLVHGLTQFLKQVCGH
ncbi:MAG: N-acetylmuramoyl-L-alanine amidase [Candidatus Melainabacteria bacterium]|nr:N-acetylmuramoyl-L-alanine amidase [Candidatus Melainabacteria bacterium]